MINLEIILNVMIALFIYNAIVTTFFKALLSVIADNSKAGNEMKKTFQEKVDELKNKRQNENN